MKRIRICVSFLAFICVSLPASTANAANAIQIVHDTKNPAAHSFGTSTLNTPSTAQLKPKQYDGHETVYSTSTTQLKIKTNSSSSTDSDSASSRVTMGCDLKIHNPHNSHHDISTINGVAEINCNIPAESLTLHYSLSRSKPNPQQWAATSASNSRKATIKNNRGVSCSQGPGYFAGWTQGELEAPAGYKLKGPPIYDNWGKTKYVNCTKGSSTNASENDISERIHVDFIKATSD